MTDIYIEQDRSARMQHRDGNIRYYTPTTLYKHGDYEMPRTFKCEGRTETMVGIWRGYIQKGLQTLIPKGKFNNLHHYYMELLTSKSQGDKAIDEHCGVSTTSRYLSVLINNGWMTDMTKFLNEIKTPTVSSNRFQMYRRARMVAAVNNAKQFLFCVFRLILSAAGEFASYYGLGDQTGQFKDVASLMVDSCNEKGINYNGDIAGFDSHWPQALMRFLIYVCVEECQKVLTKDNIQSFGPAKWANVDVYEIADGCTTLTHNEEINPITFLTLLSCSSLLSSNVILRSLNDASIQFGINVILTSGAFITSQANTHLNGAMAEIAIQESGNKTTDDIKQVNNQCQIQFFQTQVNYYQELYSKQLFKLVMLQVMQSIYYNINK